MVQWEGWPIEEATWEPKKNLSFVKDLVEEFESNVHESNEKEHHELQDESIISVKSEKEERPPKREEVVREKRRSKKKTFTTQNDDSEFQEENIERCTNAAINIFGLKKEVRGLSFYVEFNGEEIWVTREFLLDNYPRQLCLFYEKRLVFE